MIKSLKNGRSKASRSASRLAAHSISTAAKFIKSQAGKHSIFCSSVDYYHCSIVDNVDA